MQTARQFWSHLAQTFSEWKMCQTKVEEEVKTHILCSTTFLQNRAVYEIMWKNIIEWFRPQMAIRRMRIACWVPKATDTHSEYVIFIAFPQQKWPHECAATLRYTYSTLAVRPSRDDCTDHSVNALSTYSLQPPALPTLWRPALTYIIAYMQTVVTSQTTALA
jgi:hypothetical protein